MAPRDAADDGSGTREQGGAADGPEADTLAPTPSPEELAERWPGSEWSREPDGAKMYVDANTLLVESFKLARMVHEDGFEPDFLIALWRGGTPVGVAIHEYFRHHDFDPYHTAIKTQSYRGLQKDGGVEIKGIEHVIDVVEFDDRMLVVDDVFDTGRTMKAVLDTIRRKARRNTPEMCVATVYYKPLKRRVGFEPDYYRRAVNEWIVFPHELEGLSDAEVKEKGLDIHDLVAGKG